MRRVLAALAVLGMLVHALAIVRHTVVLADQARALQQLAADLRVMCSGHRVDVDLPASPSTSSDCPVCMGLVGAAMLPSPNILSLAFCPDSKSVRHRVIALLLVERASDRLPPPRGPPHSA